MSVRVGDPAKMGPLLVGFRGLLVVSTNVAACSADVPSDWSGMIDTLPSGVVHVRNPDQPRWGALARWQLVVIAQIGERLDAGPEVFGDIADIETDTSGRVYVFDRQAQEVRVFDHDGSYVRTIGRPGRGPGEFIANGIAIDSADQLWVMNQGNLRYSVFDTSGALVEERRRPTGGVRMANWHSDFARGGDLYEIIGYRDSSALAFALARYDVVARQVVDTLPLPPYPEGTKLFAGVSILTAEGWWQGVKHRYKLAKMTFTGDTVRVVELIREADRLSGAERDSAVRHGRLMRERVHGEYEVETARRPLFEQLAVDDLGYVWVMLPPERDNRETRFDIFDPDGIYLSQVSVPHRVDRFVLPRFRGGRVHYVMKDDLDVPYVVIADVAVSQ